MFSGQIEFNPSGNIAPRHTHFSCRLSDLHHLRLLELNDAAELLALIEANRTYLRQWLSWVDTTQTVDDTRHFIRLTRDRAEVNQGFASAILYNNMIAGVIGIHEVRPDDRSSSIGYWLDQAHQGKGLMTASCKALIDYGFEALNLNRMTILCASDNSRSRAIPIRLGFTHEGTLHEVQWIYDHFVDHEVYAMLRHQWLPT